MQPYPRHSPSPSERVSSSKAIQGQCVVGAGAIPSYMMRLASSRPIIGNWALMWLGLDEWHVQAHAVLLVRDEPVPR